MATLAKKPKVVVARMWHETHAFNPVPTTRENFRITYGRAAALPGAPVSTTLDGIVRTLEASGVEVVEALSAQAPPGGPVDHRLYVELRDEIVGCVRRHRPDGVALELHGALATDQIADADGDLLEALRRELGPDVPIGAGLDLHANVTDQMLAAADLLVACKENPHSDVVEAGERTGALLVKMLGGWRAQSAAIRVPMLLTGGTETADWPLREVHDIARRWQERSPEILDISIYNVYPFQNTPELGQVVTVTGETADGVCSEAAEEIARSLWAHRSRFRTEALSPDAAFDRVLAEPERRPFVLSDLGDRVLAGAPGDSTHLLRIALGRNDGLKGAIPVTDPEVVRQAVRAGAGARLRVELGGAITPQFSPFAVDVTVRSLGDGRFVIRGPFMTGQTFEMGPSAVLEAENGVLILATSLPALSVDPAVFESQGIDVSGLDYLVVKSGNHFKIAFRDVATPLVVDTPGLSKYEPGILPYSHKRDVYPEADIAWDGGGVRWWPNRKIA